MKTDNREPSPWFHHPWHHSQQQLYLFPLLINRDTKRLKHHRRWMASPWGTRDNPSNKISEYLPRLNRPSSDDFLGNTGYLAPDPAYPQDPNQFADG
jgi:hypothetical protein